MNDKINSYLKKSENEIWLQIQAGDKGALAYLFKRYYSLLFNYGLKMVRDEELIEDAIQDIFLKIWDKRKKNHNLNSTIAYILKSFRNNVLDRIAFDKKRQSFDSFEFIHEAESVQERIIAEESLLETHRKVDQALDALPARQREIIYLKFYRNLDYQEISEIMGINYQSVRNAVSTAIKSLRRTFVSVLIALITTLF